ncbi:MAG: 50S ribosomal protein L35ae [Euryarchaeota archaeon]|nr:50S ribosomal protein L35ae [Euryarchaeota archaeon]
MEGRIVGFRGGRREMYNHYGIVEVGDANRGSFVGRKVVWKTKGEEVISGKIIKVHGGGLMVRFRRGLPGDALGTAVEIRGAPALKGPPAKRPGKKTGTSTKGTTRSRAAPRSSSRAPTGKGSRKPSAA